MNSRNLSKLAPIIHRIVFWDMVKGFRLLSNRIDTQNKTGQKAKILRKEGIVVLHNYLSAETCDKLYHKVKYLIDQHASEQTVRLDSGTVLEVRNANRRQLGFDTGMVDIRRLDLSIPELGSLLNDETIRSLIEQAFNARVYSARINCYYNKNVSDTRDFHADNLIYLQVKAYLLLSDVRLEEDGAHAFVKRSHRFNIRKYINLLHNLFRKDFHYYDMRWINSRRVVKLLYPKGTLFITDQNGFHRGLPQKPGHERVLLVVTFAQVGNYKEQDLGN